MRLRSIIAAHRLLGTPDATPDASPNFHFWHFWVERPFWVIFGDRLLWGQLTVIITKRHEPIAQRRIPEWAQLSVSSHVIGSLRCVVKVLASHTMFIRRAKFKDLGHRDRFSGGARGAQRAR